MSTWLTRWIGKRAAIALGIGGTVALAGVVLARDVVREHARAFDRAGMVFVRRFDDDALDVVMRGFTELGSVWAFTLTVLLIAFWALRRRDRPLALMEVAVAITSALLNTALKVVFHRARPTLFDEIVRPASFSFPSGHAMVATSIYGMSAIVLAALEPRLRAPLAVLTPPAVFMIGLSRVYLGVHWPTDVIAGFAAGLVVLVAGWLAIAPARARWLRR